MVTFQLSVSTIPLCRLGRSGRSTTDSLFIPTTTYQHSLLFWGYILQRVPVFCIHLFLISSKQSLNYELQQCNSLFPDLLLKPLEIPCIQCSDKRNVGNAYQKLRKCTNGGFGERFCENVQKRYKAHGGTKKRDNTRSALQLYLKVWNEYMCLIFYIK